MYNSVYLWKLSTRYVRSPNCAIYSEAICTHAGHRSYHLLYILYVVCFVDFGKLV